MSTQPVGQDLNRGVAGHPSSAQGPIEAVWMAARRLRWHLPVLAGQETAMPYIVLEQDEPVALMFTTRRRALRAIDGWISSVVDHPIRTASVDMMTTLEVLMRLHARGLAWIRIDHGPQSIRLPLESLLGAMQRVLEQNVKATPEEATWRWIASQERILMLRDSAADDLPLVEILDDRPTVRIFVHPSRALARAAQLSLPATDRRRAVLGMDGPESIECLRRLAHLGVDQVIVEQPGGSRRLGLEALLAEARRAA